MNPVQRAAQPAAEDTAANRLRSSRAARDPPDGSQGGDLEAKAAGDASYHAGRFQDAVAHWTTALDLLPTTATPPGPAAAAAAPPPPAEDQEAAAQRLVAAASAGDLASIRANLTPKTPTDERITRRVALLANRAQAWLQLRDPESAARDCTAALRLDPGHAKARLRRALALEELGKLEHALADLDQARAALPPASLSKLITTARARVDKALRLDRKILDAAAEQEVKLVHLDQSLRLHLAQPVPHTVRTGQPFEVTVLIANEFGLWRAGDFGSVCADPRGLPLRVRVRAHHQPITTATSTTTSSNTTTDGSGTDNSSPALLREGGSLVLCSECVAQAMHSSTPPTDFSLTPHNTAPTAHTSATDDRSRTDAGGAGAAAGAAGAAGAAAASTAAGDACEVGEQAAVITAVGVSDGEIVAQVTARGQTTLQLTFETADPDRTTEACGTVLLEFSVDSAVDKAGRAVMSVLSLPVHVLPSTTTATNGTPIEATSSTNSNNSSSSSSNNNNNNNNTGSTNAAFARVGAHSCRAVTVPVPQPLLNRADEGPQQAGSQASEILVAESPGQLGIGGKVWDAALIVLQYLRQRREELLVGKHVVELGAGTGIVGMCCDRLGARRVVITDLHEVCALIDINIALNTFAPGGQGSARPEAVALPWSDPALAPLPPETAGVDTIVMSDVVYEPTLYLPLIATLSAMVAGTSGINIVLAYRHRNPEDHKFFTALEAAGFTTEAVPLDGVMAAAAAAEETAGEQQPCRDVHILRVFYS